MVDERQRLETTPRKVLVVDDEISMAEMVADSLAERSFTTTPLSSSGASGRRTDGAAASATPTVC